ncbi:MAG: 1-acyl-sn-glycerol-3-phosphate acyltransferase [Cyanobacteria bacterium P01_F01_bin.150]
MTFRFSVKPPLEFIPPKLNRWVVRLSYWALPILMKVRLRPWLPAGIQTVTVQNAETLARLFHQFQAKKIRLLIAFRHVEVDDPICMGYMFSHVIPRIAKRQQLQLRDSIHSHFMYDRGMSLWAGAWLKAFFAWMGGIPVRRGARDLKAIKAARDILINGQFPLTIAPEGATNGHSELLSPLEPGVAQLAFWGVQDLRRQQRNEAMIVVPVSIRYRYSKPDWSKLDRLLTELEEDSGLSTKAGSAKPMQRSAKGSTEPDIERYYQRLLRIGTQMLAQTERVYRRFYHVPLGDAIDVIGKRGSGGAEEQGSKGAGLRPERSAEREQGSGGVGEHLDGMEVNGAIAQHLQPLLDEMLKVGERYFGLSSEGDLPTRCRQLEEAGWQRIYRDDLKLGQADDSNGKLAQGVSAMERGFADRIAAESLLQMEHMRVVESMVAVTGHYVKDNPSFERFAETALLLFDVMQRIKGVKNPARPRLGWRRACITIGTPLSASDRWSAYEQNRRMAKDRLTDEIRRELERLIAQS